MKKTVLFLILLTTLLQAQPADKVRIGTNLSGLSDWMTEMPFVDVMHHCRPWMTANCVWVSGGKNQWDTGFIDRIPRDENGYPLSLPCHIAEAETLQVVHTIWAVLAGWPEGTYTLLYEGRGDISFFGSMSVRTREPGRIHLEFKRPAGEEGVLGLTILRSDSTDHVRTIRLLMPGTESTYQTMPYYSEWFGKLQPFKVIRFMDWGHTNNWGHDSAWECYDQVTDTARTPWSGRAERSDFTWATSKGVPYEVMIDLCNRLHADMWICVPHDASNEYIHQLALLLKNELNPQLTLYIEYSNETWNWMFGQTQWLYTFGCVNKGISWPEGIVPYIQNCMDIFSAVFSGEMERIVRVAGVQGAWQDVSNRIVFNLRPGSFDAFAPAAYFGISEAVDAKLDRLGAAATVQDIVSRVRVSRRQNEEHWLSEQKKAIADKLGIPMLYYEGGQHLTPTPFGEEPVYAQALLDVQRDTAMYSLYREWFDFLESLSVPGRESLFMNFSFIGQRSARYGSWGILESVTQDTVAIPAPKYRALINYMTTFPSHAEDKTAPSPDAVMRLQQNYPNPFNPGTTISFHLHLRAHVTLKIVDVIGREICRLVDEELDAGSHSRRWQAEKFPAGVYFYILQAGRHQESKKLILMH
jgi:hypothetical protein